MPRLTRRRALTAALSLAAAVGLAHAPGAVASEDVVLDGTVIGSDGRYVSALLGFDLKDAQGRTLGASGCVKSPSCPVEGYAVTRRVNFSLGATGDARKPQERTDGRHTIDWRVRVPTEAARVYIEAFPQGKGYAGTDNSRYAASFRRNVDVRTAERVNVRLPVVCNPAGGRADAGTGHIGGFAEDGKGRRVPLKRITAFSMEADNNGPTPVLGLGVGRVGPDGSFLIDDLASGVAPRQRGGHRYQLIATARDGRVERVFRDVRVNDCVRRPVTIEF